MSWERDPLLAKSRLFFERAFENQEDGSAFGLWCAMGLELLARAAIASVSPMLLAKPDENHVNLLYAIRREETPKRRSIETGTVFDLCHKLFPQFTKENLSAANLLIGYRNEEVHSGSEVFSTPASQWLPGFYGTCKSLAIPLGESLSSLFGKEAAANAEELLSQERNDVKSRVQSRIAAHRKVFESKAEDEKKAAKKKAEDVAPYFSVHRHHGVTCPACECLASVQGRTFGEEQVAHEDGEIVVTQAVTPTSFSCMSCELKLNGYSELIEAGLGDPYKRRTYFSPEDYFGLIDPDSAGDEYDNE